MSLRLNNAKTTMGRSRRPRRAAEQAHRPTAGQARRMASSRIYSARRWSAPRLDRMGRYVEREFGPRCGSMLRRTAGRLQPTRGASNRGVAVILLILGGLLGVIGAIASRRGRLHPSEELRRPAPAERLSAVTENPPTS